MSISLAWEERKTHLSDGGLAKKHQLELRKAVVHAASARGTTGSHGGDVCVRVGGLCEEREIRLSSRGCATKWDNDDGRMRVVKIAAREKRLLYCRLSVSTGMSEEEGSGDRRMRDDGDDEMRGETFVVSACAESERTEMTGK